MNVTVVGNLCGHPELRHTTAGIAVTELRVAENRNFQDSAGNWHQDTAFYPVIVWRRLAEHAAASLHKGDRVVVVGRMRQEDWVTEKGQTRRRHVIEADDLAASIRYTNLSVTRPSVQPQESRDYAPDDPERPFVVGENRKTSGVLTGTRS